MYEHNMNKRNGLKIGLLIIKTLFSLVLAVQKWAPSGPKQKRLEYPAPNKQISNM